MKLFLSSYQLGSEPGAFVDLLGGNKRVALLMNATDPFGDSRRPEYVAKYTAAFSEQGLQLEEVDLRKFYGAKESLRPALKEYGALWVSGGNTFALRSAMRKSGMDEWLPGALQEGSLVYGGFSAGACVMGPTLRGIHLTDEPEKVPERERLWDGLNVVDFCIAPHFRSNHPESPAIENVVAYYEANGLKFHALRDGEALCVNGEKLEKVGKPTA